ncbi:hypothetical protein COAQ111491_14025 [Comamonas aquatilis]|uniref:hypothetical protein n=1 Tax=Comamonas aquatilis TaxID=1778406 RepID=UPI0039F0BB81
MTTFLRFTDEEVARFAFVDYLGENGEWPSYIGTTAVDVLGTIQRPTGELLQSDDGPVPVMAPIPGFHVNLSSPLAEFALYAIDAPANPERIFAGA